MNYLDSFLGKRPRTNAPVYAEEYDPGKLTGKAQPLAYLIATPSDADHYNARDDDTWRFATEKETRDMQAVESSRVPTRQHPRRDGIIPSEDNFYRAPCVYTTVLQDNGIQTRYIYDIGHQWGHDVVRIRPPMFMTPVERRFHTDNAHFYDDIMAARLNAGDDIQERPQTNTAYSAAGPVSTPDDIKVPAAHVLFPNQLGGSKMYQLRSWR